MFYKNRDRNINENSMIFAHICTRILLIIYCATLWLSLNEENVYAANEEPTSIPVTIIGNENYQWSQQGEWSVSSTSDWFNTCSGTTVDIYAYRHCEPQTPTYEYAVWVENRAGEVVFGSKEKVTGNVHGACLYQTYNMNPSHGTEVRVRSEATFKTKKVGYNASGGIDYDTATFYITDVKVSGEKKPYFNSIDVPMNNTIEHVFDNGNLTHFKIRAF